MSSYFPVIADISLDARRLEGPVYWSVFGAVFLLIGWWESRKPLHGLKVAEQIRWTRHGLLFVAGYVAVWILCRTSPVAMAMSVSGNRFGLLNRVSIPFPVRGALAICILDAVRYATHRLHHSVPILWRVHRVHHSDTDYDVSTAGRFHPVEVALTQAIYLGSVYVLAPPASAVLLLEIATCFQNLFVHANVELPRGLERILRTFWLTPDLHRIHHSIQDVEQQTNYGEIFPWWDKLLGTWPAEPCAGRAKWRGGLADFADDRSLGAGSLLALPFRSAREPNPGAARTGSGVVR